MSYEYEPGAPYTATTTSGNHAVVLDEELDRLFAEPQRPRWKLGFGAVVVLALVVCAVVVLVIALQPRASGIPQLAELETGASLPAASGAGAPEHTVPEPSGSGGVFVHVTGQVHTPGVYALPSGSRVIDAITAAGGVTERADPNALNYARALIDGEQIFVPEPGQAFPAGANLVGNTGTGSGASAGGLVNINTATAEELQTLPRIGPAMAQRILDYREQIGGFTSIEQLNDVAGIGEATFAGLKDLVTV